MKPSFEMLTPRFLFVAVVFLSTTTVGAQTVNSLADIQKQLNLLYTTAKATADGSDLVTAGAVLVLQKDHLLMCKVDQLIPMQNYYKNGSINQGGLGGFFKTMTALGKLGAANPLAGNSAAGGATAAAAATREFVAGEKFFVTSIITVSDGVIFTFMSDPIKDQRYKSSLRFSFPKDAVPTPDDAAALVSEVIKIDAPDAQADSASNQTAPASGSSTKTISLGQTRDQVIATFGVPSKVVQLGSKEIDFFPDMKVTFVQNKVTEVK